MTLHRGCVVNLVDKFRALRPSFIACVELAVIHAHFLHALTPSVAVEPSVDYINSHQRFLSIGKSCIISSLYAFAIQIHRVFAVLSRALRCLPAKVCMEL